MSEAFIEEFIKENFNDMSLKDMEKHLGVSVGKLQYISQKLGLTKRNLLDIDDFIIENYDSMTVVDMAKELDVSRGTVQRHALSLGLSKNKAFKPNKLEILLPISGLENVGITNHGRVVNMRTNKLYRTCIKDGYECFSVQNGGQIKYRRVHKVLAETFIPNPKNKEHVNHIDGNKSNNYISNLEWNTPKENTNHAVLYGLIKVGEDSTSSKITENQAIHIIKLLEEGLSVNEVVEKLPYATPSIVSKLKNKSRWKHLFRK